MSLLLQDCEMMPGRVGDADLEERVPKRKSKRAHVRPGVGLFSRRPEPQPLQLPAKFVAEMVVASGAWSCVAEAGGGVLTFGVIPSAGMPSAPPNGYQPLAWPTASDSGGLRFLSRARETVAVKGPQTWRGTGDIEYA